MDLQVPQKAQFLDYQSVLLPSVEGLCSMELVYSYSGTSSLAYVVVSSYVVKCKGSFHVGLNTRECFSDSKSFVSKQCST